MKEKRDANCPSYRSGHYGRALEEAVQTNKGQWPATWNGVNPLAGGRTFNSMESAQRVRQTADLVADEC